MREGETGASGYGITMEQAAAGFARLAAAFGKCPHARAEPVIVMTGEIVAWLCPECDAQLPAGWGDYGTQ